MSNLEMSDKTHHTYGNDDNDQSEAGNTYLLLLQKQNKSLSNVSFSF